MERGTRKKKVDESSKVRHLIWDSMLSADLNYRYFSGLAARFQNWDRFAKILVAVTSSTVVSGWAIWGKPGIDWIWHSASALACIVSLALPIFDPSNSMKAASRLTGTWFSIFKDYELLWTRVDALDESEAQKLCGAIQEEEKRLVELESTLNNHRGLARRCEDEVRWSRGL